MCIRDRILADLEQKVSAIGILKAPEFDTDVVCAGDQIGGGVGSGRVRRQGARNISLLVRDCHLGQGDRGAALVRDRPRDTPFAALRKEWHGRKKQQ